MSTLDSASEALHSDPPQNVRKRAVVGAWIAFFVDLFDVYLPVIVLAPAIGWFVSPGLSDSAKSLIANVILASTVVARPVGAAIFGHIGDRIGRRRTTILSAVGFGVITVAIAALPGYAQWGLGAVVLLIVLRFIDGIFLGGTYAGANPLAMEHSPKAKRGYYSGVINTAFPIAYVVLSLITLGLLSSMSYGSTHSSYSTWGWRLPFIFGGIMGLALAWYYSRNVRESDLLRTSKRESAPLKVVVAGRGAGSFWQVLVLMTGLWTLAFTCSAVLPLLVQSPRAIGLSGRQTTVTLALAFLALIVGYLLVGPLSQALGRRRFIIAGGVGALTFGVGAYLLLLTYHGSRVITVACLAGLTIFFVCSPFGFSIAYISERFHTGVRATGFGLSYSLAIVAPSFYAFYQSALTNLMPYKYTVLVLVAIGAVLVVIGGALGPETRDVDLDTLVSTAAEPDRPSGALLSEGGVG